MLNVLLFYSTYLAGFFFTFKRSAALAFAIYQAVYYFHPQNRWWGYMVPDISYSFFTVLLMFTVFALNFKILNENKLLKSPHMRWIYFILFLFTIATFYAVIPWNHEYSLTIFFKLVIIMSVAYKLVNTTKDMDFILIAHIFGGWYLSFVAFQIGRNSGDRVEGIGTVDSPDSNGAAAAIAPSIVLALYYLWVTKNKILKGALAISILFMVNAIVLINSRGAFLGVACSVLYFIYHMFFSKFQRPYQKIAVIGIVIMGLLGVIRVADDSFVERMQSIFTSEVSSKKETGATRTEYWKAAWEMAKDHPFGAGIAGFQFYAPSYIAQNVNTGNSRNRAVHSTWFEALSEIGYLGLGALIAMLYCCYSTNRKCMQTLKRQNRVDEYFKVRAIEASLICFIVTMTFLNRMRAEVLYWLILYCACAYNVYVLRNSFDDKTVDKLT
ncbi:MAG: O-antigen ligase family protein [Paraglaciecola sp.]|uniref:O-antigen ligase family protein n=1 Tax=Paraglaciecola sp. TaxID=1920173 RepID=UPI003297C873